MCMPGTSTHLEPVAQGSAVRLDLIRLHEAVGGRVEQQRLRCECRGWRRSGRELAVDRDCRRLARAPAKGSVAAAARDAAQPRARSRREENPGTGAAFPGCTPPRSRTRALAARSRQPRARPRARAGSRDPAGRPVARDGDTRKRARAPAARRTSARPSLQWRLRAPPTSRRGPRRASRTSRAAPSRSGRARGGRTPGRDARSNAPPQVADTRPRSRSRRAGRQAARPADRPIRGRAAASARPYSARPSFPTLGASRAKSRLPRDSTHTSGLVRSAHDPVVRTHRRSRTRGRPMRRDASRRRLRRQACARRR